MGWCSRAADYTGFLGPGGGALISGYVEAALDRYGIHRRNEVKTAGARGAPLS